MSKPQEKLQGVPFIDHMRGFIFLLMLWDHALHAYAANWGRYHFFRDYDRSYIFDALYLFNQSAIMPVLFFTFGAYVLPKLHELGAWKFTRDVFVKRLIPFMVGIPLVVPLLSFPRHSEFEDSNVSYLDFWSNIFFQEKLQAGPYWVMYAIVAYTAVFLLINKLLPKMTPWLGRHIKQAFNTPRDFFLRFMTFTLVAIIVYGASDLRWGAPWWVSLKDVLPDFMHGGMFALQGSKFIMNFVYFVLGAAFMHSKAWETVKTWNLFESKRFLLLGATLAVGTAYVLYAHFYFDTGAFDYSIYKAIRLGGGTLEAWAEALALLPQVAPTILVRTSLLGLLSFLQLLTLIAFFSKQQEGTKSFELWTKAAAYSWAIFMIHDPIAVWGQFILMDYGFPILVKILIVTATSLSISWVCTKYLLKVPYVRKVFQF